MSDPRGQLAWVFAGIWQLLVDFFAGASMYFIGENVSSMDGADQRILHEGFGLSPVHICASLFSWIRRPQVWWLSEELDARGRGALLEALAHGKDLSLPSASGNDPTQIVSPNGRLRPFVPFSGRLNRNGSFSIFWSGHSTSE